MGTVGKMDNNKQAFFYEQTVLGEMTLFQDKAFFLR